MTAYFRFVLGHRLAVSIACALVTIAALAVMTRATMSSSLVEMILGEHPAYLRYAERVKHFGSDEQIVIAFEADLGDPAIVDRLERIVEGLARHPDVARVTSPLDLRGGDPAATLDPQELATHPISGGLLVSRDGEHVAVVARLTGDGTRSIERTPLITGELVDAIIAEGFDEQELHLAGMPAVLAVVHRETVRNIAVLTPAVGVLLLLTTWVLFRQLWPVLITLVIGLMAIIWTMGLAVAIDPKINILLAICPAVILIIAFSDVVHLCSTYLLELSRGRPREEAILATASEVGVACLFTSLTTLVGFLSLSIVKVPAFRQAGLVLGFGVAVALLLAMTLVPIMFSVMRPPRPWTASLQAGSQHRLDVVLAAMRHAVLARPWVVIAIFAVAVAASVWGTTRISIETDIVARFSPDNPLRRDTAYFNKHFSGTTLVDLYLEPRDESWQPTFETLGQLQELQRRLQELPGVNRVISIVGLLEAAPASAMRVFADETPTPGSPVDPTRLIDVANRRLRFSMVSADTGMYAAYELGQAARVVAEEVLGEPVVADPSGVMYLSGLWLEDNIRSQRTALIASLLVISIVMAVLFRSAVLGAWSMLPNIIPLLALGGVLGTVWSEVDSDLAFVALIAIGIAVDDTIHFLARYRHELRRTGDVRTAIEATYATAGRAIVMTSVIFAVGFAPLALSGYWSIQVVGLLLPGVMIVALLADLLLLPALIAVGAIPDKRSAID